MIVGVLTTCQRQYTWDRSICVYHLIEQHSKFLLHTLQVLYMYTLCDSTNIKTIIEFVPHVSGDGFNGGSDSYLQFRNTHAPCLLKLCIPPSNGIVRWWLFPEFGAELPLDNCTPTIILNNPVFSASIRPNESNCQLAGHFPGRNPWCIYWLVFESTAVSRKVGNVLWIFAAKANISVAIHNGFIYLFTYLLL